MKPIFPYSLEGGTYLALMSNVCSKTRQSKIFLHAIFEVSIGLSFSIHRSKALREQNMNK